MKWERIARACWAHASPFQLTQSTRLSGHAGRDVPCLAHAPGRRCWPGVRLLCVGQCIRTRKGTYVISKLLRRAATLSVAAALVACAPLTQVGPPAGVNASIAASGA